ncbi:MAG TPA: phosphatidylglycerol lysyltransferase domain-containing protein [Armatimonadota bacterium]|jgi:hypothetical protein
MDDLIPVLPETVALGREHRPQLQRLLSAAAPRVSELTFTNLFMWRHAYGTRLGRIGEVVCLFCLRADPTESFLLPPLGSGAGAEHVRAALAWMAASGHDPKLARADQRELDRLGLTPAQFTLTPDRDNWDYVYRVPDLIDLAGEDYRDKRRHVDSFTRKFPYEYRRITPDLVPACQALQDLWCDDKHCDLAAGLRAEAEAVKEVLAGLEELEVTGGALLVNQRVQAFALGEALSADTVVIHIEKASPDLHGAFQVINREFLVQEWSQFAFVNREQDLGIPGLREAKESYHPAQMVEKYVVRLP